MFSVSKFCFAEEDPGIYSVSHVSSTGIEAEQKSMPLWSFRKCHISIKEAVDKQIKLEDTPEHIKKRGSMLTLGPSNIEPGDPRLNLFRVLGPDDNPFTEERNELSVLLAEKEEDLEDFANESWKHLDIFGSSTNLVRALQKLEKDIIGHEVKGDFYRLKAALRLLIPDLEVKGKRQSDLSRVLEDYCNKISTGTIPEPKIPENLRYTLIRLNYGCERGDPSVVAFRHQFANSTTSVKAYPRKTISLDANGNPTGEETVLIPNHQIGRSLNYKTVCLQASENDRDPTLTFISRIMPRGDGTDLEVTSGGVSSIRSHRIMETESIKRLIHKCHISFTETKPEPDGSKRSGQRSRILVNLDKIGTLDCYDQTIQFVCVNPKVILKNRARSIKVSNINRDKSDPSHWIQAHLFGEACSSQASSPPLLNKLSVAEREHVYSIFGIDCSFLTKKAERNKILKERAGQAWDSTLRILQDQFGDFYEKGVSLIVPRTYDKISDGTVDCVTPPIGRYLLQSYREPNLVKVNNSTDVPGVSDPVTDNLGKTLKSNSWDQPWSSIERTYLLPQRADKSMVDIAFLPTKRNSTKGRTPKGLRWDSCTAPVSPLVSLFIGLGKTLIKDGTLKSSTCGCGLITTSEEWDEIGISDTKSHNCIRCSLFKSIILHLFSAFVQDRTVRGSYFEWWKPGKGHLDMRKQISSLFSPSSGLSENLPKEIHLVYHKGAIVDDPRLRYYCGKDNPHDQRSAEPAGATSGAETPDSD